MSEYAAYSSPLRFLNKFRLDINSLNPKSLQLKKKELLLEIQLEPNQILEIDGIKFTKNDVIQNFEELAVLEDFSFHKKITENADLLYFLQDQTFPEMGSIVDSLDFQDDEEFYEFREKVSPYLAFSLNRIMGNVIGKVNYQRLMLLEPIFELLRARDYHFAFKKFIQFNADLQLKITQPTPFKQTFEWEEYQHLDSPALYELANFVNIEVDNFSQKLAISIVNLTVKYQRFPGRKNYLVRLSEHALKLECTPEVKEIMMTNLLAFRTTTEKNVRVSRGPSILKTTVYIAFSFLIIYFISNIFTSTSSRENENFVSNTVAPRSQQTSKNAYDFNTEDFKKLHKKITADLTSHSLVKFTGSSTPNFHSPLEEFDKNMRSVLFSRGNIVNETRFDLLVVYLCKNGLRSYHIPPFSQCAHAITPSDQFFVYSGSDWSSDMGIDYSHFSSTQNRTFWMAFQGHYEKFTPMNLALLKQRFSIPAGVLSNLIISEHGGQILPNYNGMPIIRQLN